MSNEMDPYLEHKMKLLTDFRRGYRDGTNAQCDGKGFPIYTIKAGEETYWKAFRKGYKNAQKALLDILGAIA